MFRLITFLCLVYCSACSDAPGVNAPANGKPVQQEGHDTVSTTVTKVAAPFATSPDTLRMAPGSDSIAVWGSLTGTGRDTLYHFEVTKPAQLEARIIPDNPKLNIRFNQVLMPGSGADGPFGQRLSYSVKKAGWYALRIGPNRMAEGDTSGRFRLTVSIR
ncbi:MAG: hypothetical protein EOP50_13670 [Sphingobacteriales bacterium]|nr:MAG: hypothetical protein EOP50_13670 [Sphingobacteriales bacterium]